LVQVFVDLAVDVAVDVARLSRRRLWWWLPIPETVRRAACSWRLVEPRSRRAAVSSVRVADGYWPGELFIAHLDYGQPRTNTFHHPEKLLADGDGDDDP